MQVYFNIWTQESPLTTDSPALHVIRSDTEGPLALSHLEFQTWETGITVQHIDCENINIKYRNFKSNISKLLRFLNYLYYHQAFVTVRMCFCYLLLLLTSFEGILPMITWCIWNIMEFRLLFKKSIIHI